MGLIYECRLLDERGNAFVLESARQGLSLARGLAADAERVARGQTWAFVPSVAAPERNYCFDDSLLVGPTGGGGDAIVELIASATRSRSNLAVVGESFNSRPDDPSLEEWTMPMLIAGDEVYPVVRAHQATRERLLELIDYLDGLQGSCIFVAGGLPDLPEAGPLVVSPNVLERAARTVQVALVTAYDGEGVVVWTADQTLDDWARERYPVEASRLDNQ